ncbi:hypothetical protein PR202_ga10519 [Eleusine coracana subsp. coracana]|uniref:Uncharacterized protein n=1 Tax=Eleusine coracana subsp. coracana TaxID=191504 RepID=A0AAV5C6V1_ELECO|nr:hypothetical protein PR202_ga10519 [Eleusine coracana subsp. coracana]
MEIHVHPLTTTIRCRVTVENFLHLVPLHVMPSETTSSTIAFMPRSAMSLARTRGHPTMKCRRRRKAYHQLPALVLTSSLSSRNLVPYRVVDGMDHQQAEAAKSSSSHYDVSLELKPPLSRLFAHTADPPAKTSSSGGSVVRPALSFSHDSSRTFFTAAQESRSFARSTSRASSHFCDIEVDEDMVDDRQSVIHGVIDEEMACCRCGATSRPLLTFPAKSRPSAGGRGSASFCWTRACSRCTSVSSCCCIALNATGLALAADRALSLTPGRMLPSSPWAISWH